MTNSRAPGHPSHTQRSRAVELLCAQRDFDTEDGRLALVQAAFGGVAGAEPLIDRRPDLNHGPHHAAVALVDYLADRGCLNGRHALAFLLDQIKTQTGTDRQPAITDLTHDLDALCDRLPDATDCPYRDLRAFREQDAHLFYGRETFIQDLVTAVDVSPLVAVVGPSGSGKSSVVQAGLVPVLRQRGGWAIGILRPGDDPWGNLGDCLVDLLGDSYPDTLARQRTVKTLAADLAAEPPSGLSLPDLIRLICKQRQREQVLLVVDQWEEHYTHQGVTPTRAAGRDGLAAANRFADSLIAAAAATPLRVVLTLRADFYHLLLAHRPLVDAIRGAGLVSLSPMTRDELEQAIVGPARAVGLDFEGGLVERILDDAGREPGQLPLLEFCLSRLWARRQEGCLSHAAYQAIGAVGGAIVQHADAVIDALPETDRERARDLFLRLVQLDEAAPDTRRRATLAEVGASAWPLVTHLADARLLVTGRDAAGEQTLEVAHEALIRTWPRLRGWLTDARDGLRLTQIERAAAVWADKGRAADHRWPDSRVMEAAPALARIAVRFPLGERERAFLGPMTPDDLLARLADPSTDHGDRARIGDRLNLLPGGDPRPGTGLRPDGVPDIQWCDIPAGTVELAIETAEKGFWSRLRRRSRPRRAVAAFRLAKYPITVRQWQAFLDDPGGFDALIRTPYGAAPDRQVGGDNHPAVNVTWVEAMAYCQWLTHRLGQAAADGIRLPTEWEWQQAAGGGEPGRQYPWDRDWSDRRANSSESNLGRLTAVGLYPEGASRQGAMDLAGNVWEWCLNCYDRPEVTDRGGDASRVVRGGSWDYDQSFARAAYRNRLHPRYRGSNIGFRLVCASPIH